jgi:hypothetical protein
MRGFRLDAELRRRSTLSGQRAGFSRVLLLLLLQARIELLVLSAKRGWSHTEEKHKAPSVSTAELSHQHTSVFATAPHRREV